MCSSRQNKLQFKFSNHHQHQHQHQQQEHDDDTTMMLVMLMIILVIKSVFVKRILPEDEAAFSLLLQTHLSSNQYASDNNNSFYSVSLYTLHFFYHSSSFASFLFYLCYIKSFNIIKIKKIFKENFNHRK